MEYVAIHAMNNEPVKNERPPAPPGTDLCALADVADGKSRVVPFKYAGPGAELIVVRAGDDVYGYVNECRHMGTSMNLLDDFAVTTNNYHIQCEIHYATFRFSDGLCVAGPCQGKSLKAVPVTVRAGRVVVAAEPAAK